MFICNVFFCIQRLGVLRKHDRSLHVIRRVLSGQLANAWSDHRLFTHKRASSAWTLHETLHLISKRILLSQEVVWLLRIVNCEIRTWTRRALSVVHVTFLEPGRSVKQDHSFVVIFVCLHVDTVDLGSLLVDDRWFLEAAWCLFVSLKVVIHQFIKIIIDQRKE